MGRYAQIEQYTAEENDFWKKFLACAGHEFKTLRGLEFSFEVRGNEVFFDRKSKSITRATVIRGLQAAKELLERQTNITGPKQLGVFGASYLWPVFKALDVL